MAGLIIAESAIFTIFVVAYLFYLGKSLTGPTPREVLETPIFYTICLLSSSLTIHFAGEVSGTRHWIRIPWTLAAHHCAWWTLPLWHRAGMAPADLRTRADDLDQSVRNNLLLAGRPARVSRHRRSDHAHDRCGASDLAGRVGAKQSGRIEVLSMYWHFVDAVWVVVFTVVYVLGR